MSKSDTGCYKIPNKTIKPKSFIQPLILLHQFISFQGGALCTSHLLTERNYELFLAISQTRIWYPFSLSKKPPKNKHKDFLVPTKVYFESLRRDVKGKKCFMGLLNSWIA